jgi:hypothetical protein
MISSAAKGALRVPRSFVLLTAFAPTQPTRQWEFFRAAGILSHGAVQPTVV